jgi:hypothetical protein
MIPAFQVQERRILSRVAAGEPDHAPERAAPIARATRSSYNLHAFQRVDRERCEIEGVIDRAIEWDAVEDQLAKAAARPTDKQGAELTAAPDDLQGDTRHAAENTIKVAFLRACQRGALEFCTTTALGSEVGGWTVFLYGHRGQGDALLRCQRVLGPDRVSTQEQARDTADNGQDLWPRTEVYERANPFDP